MGRMKDLLINLQENSVELHVAKILGISFDDLMRLDWEIETDQSKDGLIYGHRIEFSHNSPQSILKKIENIEDGCRVYLEPGQLEQEYDYEELFETIVYDQFYVKRYKDEIANLEKLLKLKVKDKQLKEILNRQIFIGVISTMEAFLSEAFINLSHSNNVYLRNFVKTHPEFQSRKIELRDVFEEHEKIKDTAKTIMLDTIYHNLPKVSPMYQDTFNIKFPQIKDVFPFVIMRHDLVHRNGRTKDGKNVNTDDETINELISIVDKFIFEIIEKLKL